MQAKVATASNSVAKYLAPQTSLAGSGWAGSNMCIGCMIKIEMSNLQAGLPTDASRLPVVTLLSSEASIPLPLLEIDFAVALSSSA